MSKDRQREIRHRRDARRIPALVLGRVGSQANYTHLLDLDTCAAASRVDSHLKQRFPAIILHRTESGVDYRFVLGRAFRVKDQTYVVSALGKANDVEIVRAATRINGEQVMHVFPASIVVDHLLYDEEIVVCPVAYA